MCVCVSVCVCVCVSMLKILNNVLIYVIHVDYASHILYRYMCTIHITVNQI